MLPKRIIVDRQIVLDGWQHLEDAEPVPAEGPVTVTRARWQAEGAALTLRGSFGVRFESDEDPFEDQALLHDVPLVVLHFPAFNDGRPLSYARKLRTRAGYQGQIRATGDVLRDQLLYMWRCGFDAFEVRADKSIDDALAAFKEFTVDYQPGTPHRVSEPKAD